ncbi:hypothetical protein GCM10027442_19710 [Emticicia fontis]
MFIKVLLSIFIISLFLYSRLLPYKDRLDSSYKAVFVFFENIFSPILKGLGSFMKPVQVGQGISLDMTQLVLLIILLVLNVIFR